MFSLNARAENKQRLVPNAKVNRSEQLARDLSPVGYKKGKRSGDVRTCVEVTIAQRYDSKKFRTKEAKEHSPPLR